MYIHFTFRNTRKPKIQNVQKSLDFEIQLFQNGSHDHTVSWWKKMKGLRTIGLIMVTFKFIFERVCCTRKFLNKRCNSRCCTNKRKMLIRGTAISTKNQILVEFSLLLLVATFYFIFSFSYFLYFFLQKLYLEAKYKKEM